MKILILKLKHIGDTLIMTPAIHLIRQNYPNAKIDIVVRKGCEGVLEDNKDIDNIFIIAPPEKKKRTVADSITGFFKMLHNFGLKHYDYAFDLSNSDRAKLIILLSASRYRGINIKYAELGWKRFLFNKFSNYDWVNSHQVYKDFQTIKDIMNLSGKPGLMKINTENVNPEILSRFNLEKQKYVVMHPVSRWTFKEWEVERWKKIAAKINELGFKVLISSGPERDECKRADRIMDASLSITATEGKTTLKELAYIIKNATLFIGVDTAAMHIAAAVETPVIILMGASYPTLWGPWSEKNINTPYEMKNGIQHIGKHTVIYNTESDFFYENGMKKSKGMRNISVNEVEKVLSKYFLKETKTKIM